MIFLFSVFDVDDLSLLVLSDLLLLRPLILVFCWLLYFSRSSSDGVSLNSFFLPDFVLSLLVVVVVSTNWSCFVNVLFSNGFTLFFDNFLFVFVISLHLDIWSNNEFTSWSFSFNSLWRMRIWLAFQMTYQSLWMIFRCLFYTWL